MIIKSKNGCSQMGQPFFNSISLKKLLVFQEVGNIFFYPGLNVR